MQGMPNLTYMQLTSAFPQIREDEEGVQGVFLQKKELNAAAGQCIRATLRKLAPLILPWSELVRTWPSDAVQRFCSVGLCKAAFCGSPKGLLRASEQAGGACTTHTPHWTATHDEHVTASRLWCWMQARVLTDKAYKPNLGLAIDHILIHTGAALVISSVAEALQLGPKAPLPSMETLERFGNTSVCSTYYILANIESKVPLPYTCNS